MLLGKHGNQWQMLPCKGNTRSIKTSASPNLHRSCTLEQSLDACQLHISQPGPIRQALFKQPYLAAYLLPCSDTHTEHGPVDLSGRCDSPKINP